MAFDDLPAPHAASHTPGASDPLTGYVDTSTAQSGIAGNKIWQGAHTFNGSIQANGLVIVNNGLRTPPSARAGTTTLSTGSPYYNPCDATGGAFTITLASVNSDGYRYMIIKTDSSANVVTVNPGTSINGVGSVKLYRQFDSIEVASTTSAGVYRVLNINIHPVIQVAAAYTVNAFDRFVQLNTGAVPALPAASTSLGYDFYFTNTTTAAITLTANGTDKIGNTTSAATTYSISAGATAHVVCNGTGWLIL